MNWTHHAGRLAAQVTHPASRWRPVIPSIPRHVFVPRWWQMADDGWELRDGTTNVAAWMEAAYSDRSLVTQIGTLHADHATHRNWAAGRPTSSATLPGLLVQMYRHAYLHSGLDVLDVGTGSGYGAALLAARLGDEHVTSVDVDAYLTEAAAGRLNDIGLHPKVAAVDATRQLPGAYDRIIATVAVRPVPASWLAALRPGGRLVTTIAGTALILTADKVSDGGAEGRIEWDRAGFMTTRAGSDYPPVPEHPADIEIGQTGQGRYPVVNIVEAWELWSMLGVILGPGVEHSYQEDGEQRTAWVWAPDGSWACATACGTHTPIVHQGGPRRLWDEVDRVRDRWLADGQLPVYGARARVDADGTIHLRRGGWEATISV